MFCPQPCGQDFVLAFQCGALSAALLLSRRILAAKKIIIMTQKLFRSVGRSLVVLSLEANGISLVSWLDGIFSKQYITELAEVVPPALLKSVSFPISKRIMPEVYGRSILDGFLCYLSEQAA